MALGYVGVWNQSVDGQRVGHEHTGKATGTGTGPPWADNTAAHWDSHQTWLLLQWDVDPALQLVLSCAILKSIWVCHSTDHDMPWRPGSGAVLQADTHWDLPSAVVTRTRHYFSLLKNWNNNKTCEWEDSSGTLQREDSSGTWHASFVHNPKRFTLISIIAVYYTTIQTVITISTILPTKCVFIY